MPVSNVTGRVEVEDVIVAIRPTTCLVSVMLANNETGIIMVSMPVIVQIYVKKNKMCNIIIMTFKYIYIF